MDVGDDLIFGWDWISSRDPRLLYVDGRVSLRSGPAQRQVDLLPAGARLAPRSLSTGVSPAPLSGSPLSRRHPLSRAGFAAPLDAESSKWSRPLHADHADLAALASTQRQAARARLRPGLPPEAHCADRFVDGVEVLKDGMERRLASFCLADAELRLAGADDPAFTALKA